MAGEFSVDTAAMGSVAARIRANAEEYDRIGTQLLQMAQNMGSAYDSEDNRAFVSQIQGCCDDLKAMVAKLEIVAQVLEKQKTNYETVSAHNVEQVKRLAN